MQILVQNQVTSLPFSSVLHLGSRFPKPKVGFRFSVTAVWVGTNSGLSRVSSDLLEALLVRKWKFRRKGSFSLHVTNLRKDFHSKEKDNFGGLKS